MVSVLQYLSLWVAVFQEYTTSMDIHSMGMMVMGPGPDLIRFCKTHFGANFFTGLLHQQKDYRMFWPGAWWENVWMHSMGSWGMNVRKNEKLMVEREEKRPRAQNPVLHLWKNKKLRRGGRKVRRNMWGWAMEFPIISKEGFSQKPWLAWLAFCWFILNNRPKCNDASQSRSDAPENDGVKHPALSSLGNSAWLIQHYSLKQNLMGQTRAS